MGMNVFTQSWYKDIAIVSLEFNFQRRDIQCWINVNCENIELDVVILLALAIF